MQFKVPQDVQREDTIIGPLTLRHMGILMVGGGIAYALYLSLSKTYFIEIWLPPVAIISVLTLAFAFLKIHDLPFHQYILHYLEFALLGKKRFWIQGSGTPFISPFEITKPNKKGKKTENKIENKAETLKDIDKLTQVLDAGGADSVNLKSK